MTSPTTDSLRQAKCVPCEGGVPTIGADQAREYLQATPEWSLNADSTMISRKVKCRNFVQAVDAVNQVAEVAEAEQHHPDLHITGYQNLRIDLTTHAIGGLSENDFIVAAKVDQLLG